MGSNMEDDIPEHIIGHDYIEPFRVLDHPHTDGINMGIVLLYVGILLAHLVKGPLPEVEGVGERIGLSAKGELFCPIPFPAKLECISNAPLHPFSGIDRFLDSNLIGGALFYKTPSPGIEALSVFPDHHKINVFRPFIL